MKHLIVAAAIALAPSMTFAQSAKEIVLAGVDAVFVNPDVDAIDTYFSTEYTQHNPQFPNGLDVLRGFATQQPEGFAYEIGNVIADDTHVAIHARVTGFGPTPMVVVDIFRVEDGLIVEHWDVLQPEVTETASGNPMWTPASK